MASPGTQPPPTAGARVMIVDDEAPIRRLEAQILESSGYKTAQASNPAEATALLQRERFELVLTDMMMGAESGLTLVRHIASAYSDTAVIMVTGMDDPKLGQAAIALGACGYIVKPFAPSELLVSVYGALRRQKLELQSRRHAEELEATVTQRTGALRDVVGRLQDSQQETLRALGFVAEYRDDETGSHIRRMSRYAELLAHRSGQGLEWCELMKLASPMHDIGKVAIPDRVLLKPGRHTPEEGAIMRRHAEIGYRILAGSKSPLLTMAASIAWSHHEKVDGSGYPRGLGGDAIPLEGRIVAVADVFDALTTKRVYKPAFTVEKSVEIMKEGNGSHFDPVLLRLFLEDFDEVVEIHRQNPD